MRQSTQNLNCPDCHSRLDQTAVDPVSVEQCKSCGGILFGSEEFRLAKDKADPDLVWMDFDVLNPEAAQSKKSTRHCPKCALAMATVCYATTGVEVEVCADCKSIWLDKGEFQKILSALDAEATAKNTMEHLKNTLQEGLEVLNGPESLASEWKDFTKACLFLGRRLMVEAPTVFKAISAVQRSL